MRKTLEASLLQLGHPKNQKGDLKQLALVMVVGRRNNYEIVNKGMEKILEFQISKVKIPMETQRFLQCLFLEREGWVWGESYVGHKWDCF